MAVQIAESLADERDLGAVEKLRESGLRFEQTPPNGAPTGGPLEGKTSRPHRHPAELTREEATR